MASKSTATAAEKGTGTAAVLRFGITTLAAGFAVLTAGLVLGGAVAEKVIPGIADAGAATRWGLPIARLAMDLGAALTVGALVAAVALLPLESDGRKETPRLSRDALEYLRAASWAAAAWAAAAAATLVFTVADVLGRPVVEVVTGSELSTYVGQISQGTALMLVVLLAVVVALLGRTTTTPAAAFGLLAVAGVALLPPPLTGHSASAANHSVAVTGVALHVVAVAPWVGGLAVLTAHGLTRRARLDVMADRFSRMALWCYVAVGVSGLVNVIARLQGPGELFGSEYGRLAVGKMAAFAALGWFGWWHRKRTLPELAAGRPWALTRLAGVEAAVMAATMGLAVALARTAPPAPAGELTPAEVLLGFPVPPPLTPGRLATLWTFDFFFAALVVVLGALYLAGVVRLRRRGDSWPVLRTLSWLLGLLTIVAVTQTGVARYAPVLFSVHMVEHMVLSMLSPIFLVAAAPVTLALRALRPARIRGDRGPREWLTALLHSRYTAVVTHPAVATVNFVASTFVLYFTPLFQGAMRNHLGHVWMTVHFLLAGSLFFWVLIGVDPAPRRLGYPWRVLLLFVTMPFHAFFGLAVMNLGEPLARGWYTAVAPPWADALLKDQHTGGGIAWGFGEIPTFLVLVVMAFQWYLDDQRQARRLDRRADRAAARSAERAARGESVDEDDELAAYNARLAMLAERDRRARQGGRGRRAEESGSAGAEEDASRT
ncbi:copper resistance protein D [Actinomadura rubrobrunea]|uniref:Copper resistance protein D n=1 Tax=Actinomadura rubrobrunea TaxID=115335 RepID=A0A9W6PQW7_9ACTN|nr:cytochrome c oxidase assembly protein [Actinomadura rubrobrunea]GLW62954.1 copper resistance protein D [Actinomadura rubrobrunea]